MARKNGILSLLINDLKVLHGAYMPFLINGGLFISAHNEYQIGSEIFLLLNLMDNPEKIALCTKVVWVTPTRILGANKGGFGIQFKSRGSIAQTTIEGLLAGKFEQDMRTQTL